MTTTTRYFGLLLIVLGVASYMLTGRTSVTALIPAIFGAVLLICSLVALNEPARKHAMHAAVAVGLIGALAALGRGVPAALAMVREWSRTQPPSASPSHATRTETE